MGCGTSAPSSSQEGRGGHVFAPTDVHDNGDGTRGIGVTTGLEEVDRFAVKSMELHGTVHRGWQVRPEGVRGAVAAEKATGGKIKDGGGTIKMRSEDEARANEKYERFCALWPNFQDACLECCIKSVDSGTVLKVDIVNRVEYLWTAIPRIALTDMLLRSITQDGLRLDASRLLSRQFVPPHLLPLYLDLCTIKHTMAASSLTQIEMSTLRRIVVRGGKHPKSKEWIDALGGVMARGVEDEECESYFEEEYASHGDTGSVYRLESSEEVVVDGGRESKAVDGRRESLLTRTVQRQQILLQLAARCSRVFEAMELSTRFSLEISKVGVRW
jgi:hypothetical protein